MENGRKKILNIFVMSIILLSLIANSYFVSASVPTSAQVDDKILDVDGNPLTVSGDGTTSTVSADNVNIDMNGGSGTDDTASVDITTPDSHNMSVDVNNSGSVDLNDGDTANPTTSFRYDDVENQTTLNIDDGEGYSTGGVSSDLDTNVHVVQDVDSGAVADLGMEEGKFTLSGGFESPVVEFQMVIAPDGSNVTFSYLLSTDDIHTVTYAKDGNIYTSTNGAPPTVLLDPGADGAPVSSTGLNIARYFGVTTIQWGGIIVTLTEFLDLSGTIQLEVFIVYLGIFTLNFINCWSWWSLFSGYLIFGWYWRGYSWIWITFYYNWLVYELVYVFIWEYTGIKIEYYYISMVYIVITWWSLTIFIWWYLDYMFWEFKFVWFIWIFHWQITWRVTWWWIFWVWHIHWILPVVVLYIPVYYIPPIVDIDVYEEKYNASSDTLDLTYELKDLYGYPVTATSVTVKVEGINHVATSLGNGLYNVEVTSISTANPIDIEVSAVVPFVVLVDKLDYTLDINEVECLSRPLVATIATFHPATLIAFSGITILGLVYAISKKKRKSN